MKVKGLCVLILGGCQFSTMTPGATPRSFEGASGNGGASAPVTMPDLFLLTKPDAVAALQRSGISSQLEVDGGSTCGSVVDHKVIELGHVCYQTPAAGQQTGSRLPVTVRIQTENPWHGDLGGGRHYFLLPETIGLTLDQARDKLRAAGFSAADHIQVGYLDESGCKPNIICRMYPEAMTRSDTTSDKVLFVGRPTASERPHPADTTASESPDRQPQPNDNQSHENPPPPQQPKKSDLGDLF